MYSFFIPTLKHFSKRHRWQNLRVIVLISQALEKGQENFFAETALRRKNALQLSHVTALKL
jgi:hypothetical protein